MSILIHFTTAVLLAVFANWIGLMPWRRAKDAHWTERARLLWPVRFTAALNVAFIPILLQEIHHNCFPQSADHWIWNGLAGFLGAMSGNYPLEKEIFPRLDFKTWRRQTIAWWGIRFGLIAVLIATMLLMPPEISWRMLALASGYLVLHFAVLFGVVVKYLRWVRFARPAGPRLQKIADETAGRMGVKVKNTWQLGGVLANAFALPTTGELLFSDRLLEISTDEEVAAVVAHELGHLTESRKALCGRLVGSLALFPLVFLNPIVNHLGPLGLFVPYLMLYGMSRFARRLSNSLEKRADKIALADQNSEGVYATILMKLYRENQSPAVNVNNRQTHPHLFDRMVAAGVPPDFTRPLKPRRITLIGWVYIACLIGAFLVGLANTTHLEVPPHHWV